jgi:intracellular sulfur oxidation DsrE/DsrF family protein
MAAGPDRGGRLRLGRSMGLGMAAVGLATILAALPAGRGGTSQAERPLRVVVHVDFAQTTHERQGLGNIANILKAAGDDGLKAEVEVVCHAEGIRLVEKARTELADDVAALIDRGVRFVACENTMRQRSLAPADLLPGVATVPSGAYEIVRRQQEGYSYFKP